LDIKIIYGGMSVYTKHAVNVENFLINKEWTRENVENAGKLIEKDFSPISDARSGADARKIIAENLILKFWNETK
jgi:xanthine dehydrogenase iron-sulfur cluster and FAD-binding subunit A